MKRIIAVILLLICFTSCAYAQVNISSLSFDELIALNQRIVLEIMSRPEWKEVAVPAGEYTVGVDIPAGRYTVKGDQSVVGLTIYLDEKKDSSTSSYYIISHDNSLTATISLSNGQIIEMTAATIFTPFTGLGF